MGPIFILADVIRLSPVPVRFSQTDQEKPRAGISGTPGLRALRGAGRLRARHCPIARACRVLWPASFRDIRRYTPQPMAEAKNAPWPVVSANDRCGGYQPSEKAAATA